MDNWYCIIDGRQHGPMPAEDLIALAEQGRLTSVDLVSQGGEEGWVKGEQVEGLFDTATKPRPPIAPYRTDRTMPPRIWIAGAGLLILVLAGVATVAIRSRRPGTVPPAMEQTGAPGPEQEITGTQNADPAPPAAVATPKRKEPTVVSAWMHRVRGGRASKTVLYSNGRINRPDGAATWTRDGRKMEFRWPNERAPGGAWVDRCQISSDGRTYAGRNQQSVEVSGTLVPKEQALADGNGEGDKPAAPGRAHSKAVEKGLVTLSVPDNTWVPVTWRTGSFFGGISYETPSFPVAYERNGFAGEEVEIVSALEAATEEGETLRFSASWSVDLGGESGQIKCHWSDPMGTRDYSGKGFLTIYLKRKGTDQKISNEIHVPLALDEKYKQSFAAKYGPFSRMD